MSLNLEISSKNLKKAEIAIIFALTLLVLVGVFGIIQIHTKPVIPIEPYESALNTPWKLLVALYVFFVVSTTGLCIIAALGEVFGVRDLEPVVKDVLLMALVTILVGLLTIGLEIERVERGVFAMLGHTNPKSIMFWMIMFYLLYFIFLIGEMWFYFREDLILQAKTSKGIKRLIAKIILLGKLNGNKEIDKEFAKKIGFVEVVTAVMATSNLGALFAVNYLPLWHDPLTPIYILLTGIVSGSALAIVGILSVGFLRGIDEEKMKAIQFLKLLLVFSLIVMIFFIIWRFLIKIYPTSNEVSILSISLFFSKFLLNFWFFEIIVGIIVPLILLVLSSSVNRIFIAGLFVLVGIFVSRINFVIGGQILKEISGGSVTYGIHPFEIMAASGFIALAILLYYIGYKLLPMGVKHEEKRFY